MSKTTYWMRDESGDVALITGTDERDRWIPHGLAVVDGPRATDRVWLRHDVTGLPALFPAAVMDVWAAKGWKPGAPPEPVSLLNAFAEPTLESAPLVEPIAAPAAGTDKPPAAAAADQSKKGS